MNFQKLFNLLDYDVYIELVKRVNMKRLKPRLQMKGLNREFQEKWKERVDDIHEQQRWLLRNNPHGRVFLRPPGRGLMTIAEKISWTEIDGLKYTIPDKYWIGGRLLKPNNHRIIPSHGFSFYLNNSDLIHIIDDVGKDHVMGLFQSVKREYPTIQGNEQLLKKTLYLYYGCNYENDFE